MGFFSTNNSSFADVLKDYLKKVAWKLLAILIGWIGVYFLTQLFHEGVLVLLNLLVGSLAGVIIGWTLGEDAVSDTTLTGMPLWSLLTTLGLIPILAVEITMYLITHWQLDMGRYMCIGVAGIMLMVSAVWRASSDE